jgi:Fic family protein
MKFLHGLSEDLRKNLLDELRVLWTHASTAIEGNTLTLGETAFVLREGLTISAKPLKDHREVEGHAREWPSLRKRYHGKYLDADFFSPYDGGEDGTVSWPHGCPGFVERHSKELGNFSGGGAGADQRNTVTAVNRPDFQGKRFPSTNGRDFVPLLT